MESKTGESEPKKSKKRVSRFGALAVETNPQSNRPERRGQHADALHQVHAPEHIGHVLVTANEQARPRAEKHNKATQTSGPEVVSAKRIQTMSRAELLALSEKIMVDGTSLRQVYETHLVGERGLRRLIAEYYQGGDLNEALRRELLEREIDFERDPAVRDMNPQLSQKTNAPTGKAALEQMLKVAAEVINDDSEELAFYKANAAQKEHRREKQQRNRRLFDLSLGGVIALLIVLVIVLWLTRH